jgi:hypothetical protein
MASRAGPSRASIDSIDANERDAFLAPDASASVNDDLPEYSAAAANAKSTQLPSVPSTGFDTDEEQQQPQPQPQTTTVLTAEQRQTQQRAAVAFILGTFILHTGYGIMMIVLGFSYCSPRISDENSCSAREPLMIFPGAFALFTLVAMLGVLHSVAAERKSMYAMAVFLGAAIYLLLACTAFTRMPIPTRIGLGVFVVWISLGLETIFGGVYRVVAAITSMVFPG